jgi:hypothetical protein
MQTQASDVLNDYLKWRDVVFSVTRSQVDDGPDLPGQVYGVIMDVGLSDEFVITVTAFASGESSLRTTVGGGAIGIGGDPQVAGHAKRIVSLAQSHLLSAHPTDRPHLPPAREVYFYFLTPAGLMLIQSTVQELYAPAHPLREMFARFTAIKARSEELFKAR